MSRIAATLIVLGLYALHQDFWFWNDATPLVFGVLPIGLFYHVAYTVVTAVVHGGAREDLLAVASRSRVRRARTTPRKRMISASSSSRTWRRSCTSGSSPFGPARRSSSAEDYFLAGRSLGPAVFLLSLFGANMTAFSILGASGHSFANGIVTFGLMASSSALVIPVSLLVIGTRLWAFGKRHGFMTPVQMFRDRWECGHIGTVIFAVQAALLVPYIIIAVVGGGTTLATVTDGLVPYWLGGAIVSLVIMSYVFLGGMRGTAWVNAFQTILFLLFGSIAMATIAHGMGGFQRRDGVAAGLAGDGASSDPRARVTALLFQLHVHSAVVDRVSAHRDLLHDREAARSLPEDDRALPDLHDRDLAAVGLSRRRREPGDGCAGGRGEARGARARWRGRRRRACLPPSAARLQSAAGGDDVILRLVQGYAPTFLAALLAAAVLAAVMASDSQILALSTMFTEDVFAYYGGRRRFGERDSGRHRPRLRRAA